MNLFGRKPVAAAAKIDRRETAAPTAPTTPAPAPINPKGADPKADAVATDGAAPEKAAAAGSGSSNPSPSAAEPTAEPPKEAAPSPSAATDDKPAISPSRLAFLDKGSDTMNSTSPKAPAGVFPPGASRLDPSPRRTVDLPTPGAAGLGSLMPGGRPEVAAAVPPPAPAPVEPAQRRLTVGRDILLAGEIASCDVLVVEGTVEAKLRDGHSIEVAETGLFKGSVEIDDADIAGRFEGDLQVRRRLRVRATGKIVGSVVYGELEVEAGGQVVGSIKLYDANAVATADKVEAEAPAGAESTGQSVEGNGGGETVTMGFVAPSQPNNDYQPVSGQY